MKRYGVVRVLLCVMGIAVLGAFGASTSANAGAVVYEPFDYWIDQDVNLEGQGGTSEIGLDGTWSRERINPKVLQPNLTWEYLKALGGHANMKGGYGRIVRTISSTAFDGTGLLDDGSTLWFSFVSGHVDQNMTNCVYYFAFGSDGLFHGGYNEWGPLENEGDGVGVHIWRGDVRAASWTGGILSETEASGGEIAPDVNPINLIVGKVQWGGTGEDDVIDIYMPEADMSLGDPVATVQGDIDQSAFDTISMYSKDDPAIDEIRIGATFDDVAPLDDSAPTPDPSTWDTPPTAISAATITMTATTATDPSGVEYYFQCTAGPGNDSGWQDSPEYADTGLTADTTYAYTVKTRDKSPNQNETQASDPVTVDTWPADTTPPSPDPMEWASTPDQPHGISEIAVAMVAATATDPNPNGVEYYFQCTVGPGNDSGWQDSPEYTDTGLVPDTQYTYTVVARDKSTAQNETQPSEAITTTTWPQDTAPPIPDPMEWVTPPEGLGPYAVQMTARTAVDASPYGVEYYFTCTAGPGNDSGWQDSPTYIDGGLTPETACTYTVKARDKTLAQNETAASTSATGTTTSADLLAIYEPFDYWIDEDINLAGQGGTSEIGLDGTWFAERRYGSPPAVLQPSLIWNDLNVVGGHAKMNAGYGRIVRTISSTAFDGTGLLEDGSTLWFSFVSGHVDQNMTNCVYYFAFGSEGLAHAGYNEWGPLENEGDGVGVHIWRGDVRAASWTGGVLSETEASGGEIAPDVNPINLIVGKVQFGATGEDDVIDIYMPDADLNLGDPVATVQGDIDQSAFDTISMYYKDTPAIDEIRIGASVDNVIGTGPTEPEADPNGPYSIAEGETVILDGSGSSVPDGSTIVAYDWDLDGDGDFDEGVSGETVELTYAEIVGYTGSGGETTITLRITDDQDPANTASASTMLAVQGNIELSGNNSLAVGATDVLNVELDPPPAAPVQVTLSGYGDVLELVPVVVVVDTSGTGSTSVEALAAGNVTVTASAQYYVDAIMDYSVSEVAGVPGDVDGDGCVNVADLLTVRNNLGATGSDIVPATADVSPDEPDGVVNVADLLFVRNRLGEGECQ